jgi:hypothetical protein
MDYTETNLTFVTEGSDVVLGLGDMKGRLQQIRSKDSHVKTQIVLRVFTLFKVTTCFGLYHQAIIRSQVNNRT